MNWQQAMEDGLYYKHLKKYVEKFGKDSIKIVIFEELIKNTKQQIKEIFDFLGLDVEPPEIVETAFRQYRKPRGKIVQKLLQYETFQKIRMATPQFLVNIGVGKILFTKGEKPKMTEDERELAIRYYKKDVEQLRILFQIDVPWKNFPKE